MIKAEQSKYRGVEIMQVAEATLFGADGSPQRTQTLEAQQSVELDPHEGTMRSLAVHELLPSPNLHIADLRLSDDYREHVMAAEPKNYWPRDQVHGEALYSHLQLVCKCK